MAIMTEMSEEDVKDLLQFSKTLMEYLGDEIEKLGDKAIAMVSPKTAKDLNDHFFELRRLEYKVMTGVHH